MTSSEEEWLRRRVARKRLEKEQIKGIFGPRVRSRRSPIKLGAFSVSPKRRKRGRYGQPDSPVTIVRADGTATTYATTEEFAQTNGRKPQPPKGKGKALHRISKAERECLAGDYGVYLQTFHWQNIRAAYFALFERRCQRCGSARGVQLHHLTYANLGRERARDLEALCRNCHRQEHGITRTR